MNFRKFKADYVFTGTGMVDNDHVLLTDNKGKIIGIEKEKDAGDDIETFKGIITPGFINAHCHLELSHMKGLIPEKTGLVDFVYKVVNERHSPEEEILSAIQNAENEMLANGIVAAGDICNNFLTLPQKQKRHIQYYNFIEASGWLPSASKARLERALHIYEAFATNNLSLNAYNFIVPHAPYSVSDELWKLIIPYFENNVVSIHNQEAAFEDELFLQGTGDFLRMYKLMNIDNSFFSHSKKSSLQTYFSKLATASSVILVHNTFTTQTDIEFIKENKSPDQLISFCLCVNANLYIENGVPPIEMLLQNNCNIVLGTDSLASNRNLNLLDEMKTIQKRFPAVSLQQMLTWATINGAKALKADNMLGSFERGKTPGVVLIENAIDLKLNPKSTARIIL